MPSIRFGGLPHTVTPDDWRFNSSAPTRIISTNLISEVIPLLQQVEAATDANAFAVLLLSYEASSAFDRVLRTHKSEQFPLAWAAIFETSQRAEATPVEEPYRAGNWQPLVSTTEYAESIAKIRDLIARGYTYQVNYSLPFVCEFSGSAEAWFEDLCNAQKAPYSAYLDLGRYKILSLSPELFFRRQGDSLTTRPMKGTARRGRWLEEDEEVAERLQRSEKDQAENVMIVDLLRNDLGKISQLGTVKVSELFKLERYDTLWQMTSTIGSRLQPNIGLVETLAALFPCGSITGAPKIRTMEIIRDLEPYPRNIFTGTIGLIRPGGDCCFSVAIRTVLLDSESGRATFGVGGGITADSTAIGEYDECLTKAAFLNSSIPDFDLIEKIKLEDGEYFLLERHLARLEKSIKYFGFFHGLHHVSTILQRIREEHSRGSWTVRLLVARDGTAKVEMTASSISAPAIRTVKLASFAVNSNDPFLFHKTTLRKWYDRAGSEREGFDDVILWNENGELTESTIANIVVSIEGRLYTPPRHAGLLAGTFREELLEQGKISERTIRKDELRPGTSFFLVNSVQKWMTAQLDNPADS